MNYYAKLALAFVAGAATGAITGLLLAPAEGSETRDNIAGKGKELWKNTKKAAEDLVDKACRLEKEMVEEAEGMLV
jgi:gas vesicle protein